MNDNYIDQFGSNRRSSGSDNPKHCFIPAAMGILCIISFFVYMLSAFSSRSVIMCIIYFVPFLSITGLIFSFVTRDARYNNREIWLFGLISCLLSLVLFFFLFLGTMAALAQD